MTKKTFLIPFCTLLCLGLCGCRAGAAWSSLLIILGLLPLALALWGTWQHIEHLRKCKRRPDRYTKRPFSPINIILYGAALLLFLIAGLVSCRQQPTSQPEETHPIVATPTEPSALFRPEAAENNTPEAQGIDWEIFESGNLVSSYLQETPIQFESADSYFELPGICIAWPNGNTPRFKPS